MLITVKNQTDLNRMRVAGVVSADTLTYLSALIQPGITTNELDKKAEIFIRSHGCTPAFLNYKGYTKTICASVNEEIVHCIPSDRVLKDGDIITVDLGAIYEGFYGDTAQTFYVGNVTNEVKTFVEEVYTSLKLGIQQCVNGNHISDISNTVSAYLESKSRSVVKEFVGHGIGKVLHESPKISNNKTTELGSELVNGMVICIEPIACIKPQYKLKQNGPWNVETEDKSLAAHWEHTIAITENGPEVLTLRQGEIL